MRPFLCLEPIVQTVQSFSELNKNLKTDSVFSSKSFSPIFSYLSFNLRIAIGFQPNNICIPQISFAYA